MQIFVYVAAKDFSGEYRTRRRCRLAVWLCLLAVMVCGAPLHSQEQARPLSANGTDPTEARSRFDANIGRIDLLSAGYIFEISAGGDFAFSRRGSVGVSAPLVYADFPSGTTTEIGDITFNALASVIQKPQASIFHSLAIGADFVLENGDVEAGTGFGQNIIAPYLAASFYPGEGFMLAPLIKEFISLEEDESGRSIHDLSLRLLTVFSFESGFWLNLTPELIVDLNGDQKNLYTLRATFGKMINKNVGFAGDVIYQIAGEKRYDYLARLNMRYLFQ